MSRIEWTEATWNPVIGCSRVSEGCRHCYAETMAGRLALMGQATYEGLTTGTGQKTRWTGVVRCLPERLSIPLGWRKPRRIFVNSMSDLFHPAVPFEFIAAVFGVMAACRQHTFQVLTKRPERAAAFFADLEASIERMVSIDGGAYLRRPSRADAPLPIHWVMDALAEEVPGLPYQEQVSRVWPLPNVWIGVSVENQTTADERIPLLLQCPAAVRWVSAEPLLGPVDLGAHMPTRLRPGHRWLPCVCAEIDPADQPCLTCEARTGIRWVVAGGESGPGARPMHPDWVRSLRDQCQAAGVPFLFKQWGKFLPEGQEPHVSGRCEGMDANGNPSSDLHTNFPEGPGHCWFYPVGKAAAGRLLDGRTWDEYPGGAP